RAPYAGIILHSDRSDSASAIQALQADVDFFLSKQSPAFLTELLFCAKEVLERRHLRTALDHEHERHRRLSELLSDIVYELDASGCFVAISPGIATLLGYSPDELVGLPYTTLVPVGQESVARYRLNERRSGARGTTRVELALRRKVAQDNTPLTLTAEVHARGLYDSLRRFLGTIGLIRDISQSKQHDSTIHQLREQLQHRESLLALAQRVTLLSQQLHDPLASLLTQSQQLLTTIRDAGLDDRAETLAGHAAEATKLGAQLAQALHESAEVTFGYTINDVLDDVLASIIPTSVDDTSVIRKFSSHLPPLAGNREQVTKLVYSLLTYANTYVLTVGRTHRLIVSTRATGPSSISADAPTLFPLSPPTEVEVEMLESDMVWAAAPPTASPPSIDLLESYQLVRQLSGALDFSAPMQGPFRMILRLPAESPPAPKMLELPTTVSAAQSERAPETKSATTMAVPTTVSAGRQQERRSSLRIPTTLPATITVGSATWSGTISNFSFGGACVTLPGDFPTVSPQDAYVL
ncbi:MAG TPA: PAS domain S-box protein, partial [Nitrospiraceae bacterium]|nr:PAS domain S-box protein [Nitrospiraceae bacterium]